MPVTTSQLEPSARAVLNLSWEEGRPPEAYTLVRLAVFAEDNDVGTAAGNAWLRREEGETFRAMVKTLADLIIAKASSPSLPADSPSAGFVVKGEEKYPRPLREPPGRRPWQEREER